MKVLMVDQWLPTQPYAEELCTQLGHYADVTLASSRYYRAEGKPFRSKPVFETKIKEGIKGLIHYFKGLLWLYGSTLWGGYDVIHLQAFKVMRLEMSAYLLAKRLTRKKIVYTAHNILPHEEKSKEEAALKKWYRACDAIIVHNEHSKNILVNFVPEVEDKIHVIAHGAFDSFSGMAKEEKHEKPTFLLFGMVRKYKGIDSLMKAASLLTENERKQMRIVVAGRQRKDLDDTDYSALAKQYGVEDFVELDLRRIPDEELPGLFNKADCCLFPYKEIFGSGALLMAYSFEKPVIARRIPTFVEETDDGKTGLLYDAEEEKGLADAMRRFISLSEAEKNEMKKNIRRLCETKYNWKVSAQKLAQIYESL